MIASETLFAMYWAVTKIPMAVPLPPPAKRSATTRRPGTYTPRNPAPEMSLSSRPTARPRASNGKATCAATDTAADAVRTLRAPKRSVSGMMNSAETAYPTREDEKTTPAIVLLMRHSSSMNGSAAT